MGVSSITSFGITYFILLRMVRYEPMKINDDTFGHAFFIRFIGSL
jgi:hypothetical protein